MQKLKSFSICIDVYKSFEGNDFSELYEVLPTLKHKKLKINNILIEKYKNMLDFPDIEQKWNSITSTGIYRIGHDSISLMKWLICYDRSCYDNMNYFHLMGSICKYLIEVSWW